MKQHMHMMPLAVAFDDRQPAGQHQMRIDFKLLPEEGLIIIVQARFLDGNGDDFCHMVGHALTELSEWTRDSMEGPLAGLKDGSELPSRLEFVINHMISDMMARGALSREEQGFRFDLEKLSRSIDESERQAARDFN